MSHSNRIECDFIFASDILFLNWFKSHCKILYLVYFVELFI